MQMGKRLLALQHMVLQHNIFKNVRWFILYVKFIIRAILSLQWRHDRRQSVSNHQPCDCLFNGLFRRRWKKTSKLRVICICGGNSPVTSALLWRHNDHVGVSNHQPHGCLLIVYSGADQRTHQSSASLAFMRGIHRDRGIPRTKGQ